MNDMQAIFMGVPGFEAWIAVAKACQMCQRHVSAAVEPLGLELSQYDVLANVAVDEGLTQQTLARRLLVAKSNVSVLLSGLEKRGLLARSVDETDARARRIHLTPAGRDLARAAITRHSEILRAMLAALEPGEPEIVRDALRRIGMALDARDPNVRARAVGEGA